MLRQVTEVYPCTLTFQVAVQDPVYLRVDIEARVYLRQGHVSSVVRERVKRRLETMFRISNPDGTPNPDIDFGYNIKDRHGVPVGEVTWSDVFNTIRDTEGIRKLGDQYGALNLNGAHADVPLGIQQFPVLGSVALFHGDTGEPL